jgi:hypothetical protein
VAQEDPISATGMGGCSSAAGLVMQRVALAGSLFIGATLKIAYDVMLYGQFRHVRPPEGQSLHTTRVS